MSVANTISAVFLAAAQLATPVYALFQSDEHVQNSAEELIKETLTPTPDINIVAEIHDDGAGSYYIRKALHDGTLKEGSSVMLELPHLLNGAIQAFYHDEITRDELKTTLRGYVNKDFLDNAQNMADLISELKRNNISTIAYDARIHLKGRLEDKGPLEMYRKLQEGHIQSLEGAHIDIRINASIIDDILNEDSSNASKEIHAAIADAINSSPNENLADHMYKLTDQTAAELQKQIQTIVHNSPDISDDFKDLVQDDFQRIFKYVLDKKRELGLQGMDPKTGQDIRYTEVLNSLRTVEKFYSTDETAQRIEGIIQTGIDSGLTSSDLLAGAVISQERENQTNPYATTFVHAGEWHVMGISIEIWDKMRADGILDEALENFGHSVQITPVAVSAINFSLYPTDIKNCASYEKFSNHTKIDPTTLETTVYASEKELIRAQEQELKSMSTEEAKRFNDPGASPSRDVCQSNKLPMAEDAPQFSEQFKTLQKIKFGV